MRIAELLDHKGRDVFTVRPDATVLETIEEMADRGVGALVVSVDGRRPDGIVSERDVVRRLATRHAALLEDPVEAIMTTVIYTCRPDDEVDGLRSIMTEHRVRHVPVLEGGELVGIVSIGDVVKSSIDELTKDRDVLVDYISAR